MDASMIENPHTLSTEESRKEQSKRDTFRYPIHVCAIYYSESEDEKDNIRIIKKWCDENKITFKARQYNPTEYEEDAEFVARIPAYHIFWNRYHYKTTHWDERPVHQIQAAILEHKDEMEKKRRREEKIQEIKATVRGWFRLSRFKKPTRLEVTLKPKAAPTKSAVPVEYDGK